MIRRVDKRHRFTYFSGHDSPEVAAAARRRGDIGLVITPSTSYLLKRLDSYEKAIVDNGAFQQRGFRPKAFLSLLDRIAARPEIHSKIQFVVAPDVVGDARKTVGLFYVWAPKIQERGFKAALAGQNGLEFMQREIPWSMVNAFFIGGSTWWKCGAGESLEWDHLLRRAAKRGPIHMGRVNSRTRMDFASWMGASSADGTYTRFCPAKNVRNLCRFLDNVNTWDDSLFARPVQSLLSLELAPMAA